MKGVAKPRKVRPTFEGIQLCLAGAERLLADAGRVSPPTQAALLELSIEEAAKAWMLYLVARTRARDSNLIPHGWNPHLIATQRDARALQRFLAGHSSYLRNLPVDRAFHKHEVKLEFLQFLLEFLKLMAPVAQANRRSLIEGMAALNPAFNIRRMTKGTATNPIVGFVKSLKVEALPELTRIKERGLYVNSLPTGHLVAPETHPYLQPLMASLSMFLIAGLRAELQLAMVPASVTSKNR